MTDNQIKTIQALTVECLGKQTTVFDWSTEMWGAWWMPYFLYIDNQHVKLAIDNIETSDFERFTALGLIEKVKDYEETELDVSRVEISRTMFRLSDKCIEEYS